MFKGDLLKIVKVFIVSIDFIRNINANNYKQIDDAEIVAVVSKSYEKGRLVF